MKKIDTTKKWVEVGLFAALVIISFAGKNETELGFITMVLFLILVELREMNGAYDDEPKS